MRTFFKCVFVALIAIVSICAECELVSETIAGFLLLIFLLLLVLTFSIPKIQFDGVKSILRAIRHNH